MAKLKPEMEALQASVKHTGSMYTSPRPLPSHKLQFSSWPYVLRHLMPPPPHMFSNPVATEAHTEKLRLLFKKHDVHPLKSFLGMFAQAPLFITFFWTLQNMAERTATFKVGGFGQFMDLR